MATSAQSRYPGVQQPLHRGFTLLELVVVIMVAGLLIVVLMGRLRDYQRSWEQTMVDITVRELRTALRLRVAQLMTEDRMGEVPGLAGQNPVEWLEQPPGGYRGLEPASGLGNADPHGWYYQPMQRALIYKMRYRKDNEGWQCLRFRTVAGAAGGKAKAQGLTLVFVNC